MRVLEPGHRFALDVLDGGYQETIQFVKRMGARYPGNESAHGGTTMQEVLRALIARAKYVNAQTPCVETETAITAMRLVIRLFEMRAKRVKGKELPRDVMEEIEFEPTCRVCGHIRCEERHA